MADEEWLDFESYGLHLKIRDLWQEAKTGVLTSELKGYEKTLYFRNGVVTFAASGDPGDKLPLVLMRQGRFDEAQYEAVQSKFQPALSVGRNLVEVGLITQQELVSGAKRQVFEIFADCLNAESGRSFFQERDLPEGVVNLPLQFPADLIQALLDLEDKSWIRGRIGEFTNVPNLNAEKPLDMGKLGLPEFAAAAYGLIDGERDLNHMVIESDAGEFDLFKLLYALELLRYIRFQPVSKTDEDPPPTETAATEPPPEDVGDELRKAIEQDEQISQLGQSDLEETVMLSPMAGLQEADEEIDGLAEQEIAAETDQEPAQESEPETGSEDQGLDNLEESADDLLQQELERMQPAGGFEEVETPERAPEPVEEPADEPDDDDEDVETSPKKRRSTILLAGAAAIVAGALIIMLTQSSSLSLDNMASEEPPDIEEELSAFEDAPTPNEAQDGADGASATTSPEEPVGPDELSAGPASNGGSPNNGPQAAAQPVETELEIEPDDDASPAQVENTADEPEPANQPNGDDPAMETDNSPVDVGDQEAAVDDEEPTQPPLRSPIAEGWDPSTGLPAGEMASQPAATEPPQAVPPAPVSAPPVEPSPQPSREKSGTERTEAEARSLLLSKDFSAAAKIWRERLNAELDKHTIAVFMVCDPNNVSKAADLAGKDDRMFILTRAFQGRTCYWICWGRYDSRAEAMGDFGSLPEEWRAQPADISIMRLRRFLK